MDIEESKEDYFERLKEEGVSREEYFLFISRTMASDQWWQQFPTVDQAFSALEQDPFCIEAAATLFWYLFSGSTLDVESLQKLDKMIPIAQDSGRRLGTTVFVRLHIANSILLELHRRREVGSEYYDEVMGHAWHAPTKGTTS